MTPMPRNRGGAAHKAKRFTENPPKRMKDLYGWGKPVDEFPISFPIFFKRLLSVMKQLKYGIG